MEQEISLDLGQVFDAIKKKAGFILSVVVGTVAASLILSCFIISPVYEAKTSIIIGKSADEYSDGKEYSYNDILLYQKAAKTYAEIAKSRTVADKTIESLGLDVTASQLMGSITVTTQDDTQVMLISCRDKNPKSAMLKVNALANCFIEESVRIYPSGSVKIMDTAALPSSPIKPVPVKYAAAAFVLGMVVSVGIVLLMEYFDNTIKSENDIKKYIELPVMGIIPKFIGQ
jgi:capsular polysaccharide biosynthesis protein